MHNYIVLAFILVFFVLFCVFCHKKSSVFVLGIVWFIFEIGSLIALIAFRNWSANESFATDPNYFDKFNIFGQGVNLVQSLRFLVFAILTVVFFFSKVKEKRAEKAARIKDKLYSKH